MDRLAACFWLQLLATEVASQDSFAFLACLPLPIDAYGGLLTRDPSTRNRRRLTGLVVARVLSRDALLF